MAFTKINSSILSAVVSSSRLSGHVCILSVVSSSWLDGFSFGRWVISVCSINLWVLFYLLHMKKSILIKLKQLTLISKVLNLL